MSKIVVTGGAGYIGSNAAHVLVRRGFDVLVVDDLSRGHAHNIAGIPFRQLNLSDTRALTDLLAQEKADAVIHFAAYIAVGETTQNPELYFLNNVVGTISLLPPMPRTQIKRPVFSSSAAVDEITNLIPSPP